MSSEHVSKEEHLEEGEKLLLGGGGGGGVEGEGDAAAVAAAAVAARRILLKRRLLLFFAASFKVRLLHLRPIRPVRAGGGRVRRRRRVSGGRSALLAAHTIWEAGSISSRLELLPRNSGHGGFFLHN